MKQHTKIGIALLVLGIALCFAAIAWIPLVIPGIALCVVGSFFLDII